MVAHLKMCFQAEWDKITTFHLFKTRMFRDWMATCVLEKGARRGNVPLDLNALGSVNIVAFSVCGKVLGVGRGSRLKILGILGQFQPFGFLS